MTQEQGCSSHACLIAPPKGMGTNSGKCYCPQEFVRKHITTLRAEVNELKEAGEELQKENRLYQDEARELAELRVSIISERKAISEAVVDFAWKQTHSTMAVEVADHLKTRILAGEFAKGEKI